MDEQTLSQFLRGPEARERMDESIRKQFKIPASRYYTVTLPPGPAGEVFVDGSRTRVVTSQKLSKSDQEPRTQSDTTG